MVNLFGEVTILRAKVIPNSLAFETSILLKPTLLLSSKAKELTAVDFLMFQCMLGTCCCHCPLVAFAGWCSEPQNALNTLAQGLLFHCLGKHSYDVSLCGSVRAADFRHRKSK